MRTGVRSDALEAAAVRLVALADEVRAGAHRLATAAARVRPPPVQRPADAALLARWLGLEAAATRVVGPGGLWGEAVSLDALALHLRAAARAYVEVEAAVAATMSGVRAGADLAGRGGWLSDGSAPPVLTPVPATLAVDPARGFSGASQVAAAGEGLEGGRVRVVEVTRGHGGSAWVVVVPGTQEWSPRAASNPFDLTTDVRAVTGAATGDVTVAAAGVAGALGAARAAAGPRSTSSDPVLLVGHSQGGILAAALAGDPGFTARHHVTHLLTTGAPIGLFPLPARTRVLCVERGDDPVPRLDLSANPERSSWVTVRTPGDGLPVEVSAHRLGGYVAVLRTAEGAPRGTVPGVDAWAASAGDFLHAPVRSVTEVVVSRGDPPQPVADSRP